MSLEDRPKSFGEMPNGVWESLALSSGKSLGNFPYPEGGCDVVIPSTQIMGAQDTRKQYAVHHQWPECGTIDRNAESEVLDFPDDPD